MRNYTLYYWTDVKYMLSASAAYSLSITEKEFKEDYMAVYGGRIDSTAESKTLLEELMAHFNSDENPLGTEACQKWIRRNLKPHPHTSMSTGDVLSLDNTLYLCMGMGWRKLPFGEGKQV